MSTAPPQIATRGALRAAGFGYVCLRDELRRNLEASRREARPLFPGIVGYEDSVIPALENALLCGHDLILLGERGQAKTRMIRAIVNLLDEWIPVVAGSEIQDDPFEPVSAFAKEKIAREGDDTEIVWLHRAARYGEKLATPEWRTSSRKLTLQARSSPDVSQSSGVSVRMTIAEISTCPDL